MADEQQVAVEPAGLDIESTVEDIAEALLPREEEEPAPAAAAEEQAEQEATKAAPAEPEKATGTESQLQSSNQDQPPDTWRKEAKEAWAAVPAPVKEELRKREADIAGYVERVKQPIAVGERLTQLIQPYLADFQKTGTDPWANMQAMFQIQDRLMYGSPEEKLAIVQGFAQQAGIKFENGQLNTAPDAQAAYVKELEKRLVTLEGGVNSVTSVVHEARLAELQQNIRKFAEDTEAHPHFHEVADEITHLIQTGAARDLEHAYKMACSSDPVISQKMFDAAVAKAQAASKSADKDRAEQARSTARVRVRSTTTGTAAQPLGSIDDTLKDTLASINSRPN